jgi:hypothetical protein
MHEKKNIKGVGYMDVERIVSTQEGADGAKLVEKQSATGNVITERTELEAERQLNLDYNAKQTCPMDYINFSKEADFEYMPVSCQTGRYDQKWVEKVCVQNHRIGAALTKMHTHAEHLQKTTEVKTKGYAAKSPVLILPNCPAAVAVPVFPNQTLTATSSALLTLAGPPAIPTPTHS